MFKIPDFSLAPRLCKQAGLDLVSALKDFEPCTLVSGDLRHFDTTVRCAAHYSGATLRLSVEVSVHVSSHFFALNDRRDRQTELRNAAPWKSTISNKQQKKEERLHSKRSPCENRCGKIFASKCRQKHVCGGIALLAMLRAIHIVLDCTLGSSGFPN